jgi:phage-related minor tail protein
VLLQQGGQLKDMFGGIGPAARALGGYVVGLVNPFTILAGIVGVVAIAAHEGAAELRAFQNAATLTGNAIGLSNSQFSQLRESIGGIATRARRPKR